MTGRTEGCNLNEGASFIEVNSEDADRLGIADGDRVKVTSRRGSIESKARVSGKTNPGETWTMSAAVSSSGVWITMRNDHCIATIHALFKCMAASKPTS